MSSPPTDTRSSRIFKKTARFDQERKRLGATVRELRERLGWSLFAAERHSEIDQKHWQKIEAGTLNPTLVTLVRIADSFGEPVATLFARSVAVDYRTPAAARPKRRVASRRESPVKKKPYVKPSGAKPKKRST